ncbi:hypothetical protein D9758_012057 [Tetrapyrgos nigripes]|uniref:Uncharacterized protein n=1 Tax=Tetrapyrgos nigripes TaxID=182062 RepID=A0A8H5CBP4_9AGAR|nr:hypothetical protein D9758_012057 [Tetrapyrgos nigripes]
MRNLLPLVTLALTGLVAADLFVTEYAVELPNPVDGFEACQKTHCDRDLWKTLTTRGTALCGFSTIDTVGYQVRIPLLVQRVPLVLHIASPTYDRRAGDDSTSAIYKCDDSIVPLIFTRIVDDFAFAAHWSVSVSQEWPSAPAKRDFSPVKLNPSTGTISVSHTECPDGNNVTITTIDANGVTETVEGVDNLSKPMPDAFPVNGTVTISGANGRNGVGEFFVTGDNQIVVQFGGDNGPTLSTSHHLEIELCPD